jgi:acyl-CoA thioesterase
MNSLQAILASLRPKTQGFCFTIADDWAQGRTIFGGLIAALANETMRMQVPADRPLRALQFVFVGPNSPGEVVFEPNILRSGKAVTLAACIAKSNGETSMTATAMYGTARESILRTQPTALVIPEAADQLIDVPPFAGKPGFTQHYQQRWARGAAPYSRASHSAMSVYLRYRGEPAGPLTQCHALALMDAIPSPALAQLTTPGPASTLSWTLEILDSRFDFGVDEWWRLDADVDAAADGYVVHTSQVVNPAGRVAAISRQVVVVYG